jgi:hypothetical protein
MLLRDTNNFVTYFDSNYLAKGLAMVRSLKRHNPDANIFALCCDEPCYDYIDAEGTVDTPLWLDFLVGTEPGLQEAIDNRSWVEFLWTLTPSLMLRTMEEFDLQELAYVDADLYFFRSLRSLYDEAEDYEINAIPHRWSPKYIARLRSNGIYNVSWLQVHSGSTSRKFLSEWSSLCIEKCAVDGHVVGDQGYLDMLMPKYGGHAIWHLGANLAPWNQEQYDYTFDGGWRLLINKDPLLFYHFHELRHTNSGIISHRTGYPLHPSVVKYVYLPYEDEIRRICDELANL